jgi:hypothetical protein
MTTPKPFTSYLLRDIPFSTWRKFRRIAWEEEVSIRDLLVGMIEQAIAEKEKEREEKVK